MFSVAEQKVGFNQDSRGDCSAKKPRQLLGFCVSFLARMSAVKYIVVDGPIGVGKTSLAKILASEFRARPVFERVEDNPFLAKFYGDP